MFVPSVALCGVVAVAGVVAPDAVANGASAITSFALEALDWFYLLATSSFLLLAAILALSPVGDLRLGRDDDGPEFSLVSWLAMLFAAGMGSGLLFWGAAEPVWHFASPPPGGEAGTVEAARRALVITNLHWGFHAWGIYGIGALTLAWFGYRKGTSFLPSAPVLHEIGGPWARWIGAVADVVAVLAVVFGVAGSLGMGLLQVMAGLHVIVGTPTESAPLMAGLLVLTTIAYLVSASTSLDRGIQILSNLNMALAVGILAWVLLLGPTGFLMQAFTTSIGDYLGALVPLSTRLFPYRAGAAWSHAWTLTYLVWWVAWAPFTGVFIARISRGRTIREFLLGVVCAPTLFSLLWFGVFGGTGLFLELFGGGGFAELVLSDVTGALFGLFAHLPGTRVLDVLALALVMIFLVTSADSASFVLGMLTTGGSGDPPATRKVTWGVLVALLAAAGMFSGGGVPVLRALAIVGAVPFTFVLLLQVTCMLRSFLHDLREGA
ncbi:MAG: BCCT family transporter [Myxococcota bacterium]